MVPSIAQLPTRSAKYLQFVNDYVVRGRQAVLNLYQRAWADFWNEQITGTNAQGQPVRGYSQNSDLTPADKLLLLGAQGIGFLAYASASQVAAASLNLDAVVPGVKSGFRFFPDPDNTLTPPGPLAGWVYLQQIDSTGTWITVKPSSVGILAAQAAGIVIPPNLN